MIDSHNKLSLLSMQYELSLLIGQDLDLKKMLSQFFVPTIKMLGCQSVQIFIRADHNSTIEELYAYPSVINKYSASSNQFSALLQKRLQGPINLPEIIKFNHLHYAHFLPIGDIGFALIFKTKEPINDFIIKALSPIFSRLYLSCLACIEYNNSIKQRFAAIENEKRLDLVLQSVDDVIFRINSHGQITEANTAWSRITGFDTCSIIGQQFNKIIKTSKKHKNLLSKYLNTSTASSPYSFECEINDSKNKSLQLEGQIRFIDHASSDVFYLVSLHNITQNKALVKKLTTARRNAEIANEAKTTFLSNVSHELRTPLNAILGMTEAAQSTSNIKDTQIYLQNILESSQILLNMINDILDFSSIESKDFKLNNITFNLRELIENSIPLMVYGDPVRLRQILGLLVNNAIKYTQSGGVTLSVKKVKNKDIYFSIADTGIGVSDNDVRKIFRAFTQSDEGYSRTFGGIGLGLSISERLVKAMNGDIGFTHNEPRGSVFWFTLPLLSISVSQLSNHNFSIAENSYKLKVLVVDDHPINQKLLQIFLHQLDHNVILASNGLSAIDLFNKNRPDLVLMDIQMPGMDGHTATKQIRELEQQFRQRKQTPILAISANTSQDDISKSFASGMNGHLAKPISRAQIQKIIGLVCHYWQSNSQSFSFR